MASRDYDTSGPSSDESDESDEERRDRKKEKRKPPPKQVAKRMTPGGKGVKDQRELSQKLKERIAQSMIHKLLFFDKMAYSIH